MIFYPERGLMIPSHDAAPGQLGIPSQNICKCIATIFTTLQPGYDPYKRYIHIPDTVQFPILFWLSTSCAVYKNTRQQRERVQHSKLIDFYITMPRGAKRTFQRAWTPNPQRHHRHVNCDAKRISAFTGHGVNRTARILHKLFCKRAQIC